VGATDTEALATLLGGAAIVVGIVGIVVPILPGLLLCWAGVLAWALLSDYGAGKWVILGIVTLITLIGVVVKYAWPGRNLKRVGVPTLSLAAGGILGLVGFFVVPVVGLVLGFVLGVFLAERVRLGDSRLAWPSTKHAVKAVGLSMLIELTAGLGIGVVWVLGLVTLN
jgi:hypothetical protein